MAAPRPDPERDDGSVADDPRIAERRARGQHRVDPVGFVHAEALARRAATHDGGVRQVLDEALAQQLAALDARHASALLDAEAIAAHLVARHPQAADDIERLLADADLGGLRRLAGHLDTRSALQPLRELVRELDRHAALPDVDPMGTPARAHRHEPTGPAANAPAELKAVRQARGTWSRLRIDQQLAASLAKIPDNPGPLNSHLLVLRALRRMQDISPAYLHRLVSQLEALMWLEQAALVGTPPQGKVTRREAKPRAARKPA